jgi:ATP-dependent DNA helicase RecG
MMELAVDVMKRSVAERRDDSKTSPLVGAVLVRPDGSVETAYRGELREGDHAEYTLLERKHRSARLDGSVLFATLEPCAPGARKHPKLSCAERIVNARIREVWVGIEDPDPSVDRNGLRFLQKNHVTVHMFDPDLQGAIRAANREFLRQAATRAAEAKRAPTVAAAASGWDKPMAGATREDLSESALGNFQRKLGVSFDRSRFERLLHGQGFLVKHGQKAAPTKIGYLAFGKFPRDRLPQAGLKGMIEYPDGREEVRDFNGPLLLIPEQVERWLKDKLPLVSNRSSMERTESFETSFELIREGVINALVHRDYDVEGATCHVLVTVDTITIRSPGNPPSPVTIEQMQAFKAPMLNRNPKLQFVFGGARLAEGRGLGMKTLAAAPAQHGLPLPKYAFDGIYLNLTIYRHGQAAVQALGATVLNKLSRSERSGWEWLASKGHASSSEYAARLGVDDRTARRHLNQFFNLGLVRKTGASTSTEYQIK